MGITRIETPQTETVNRPLQIVQRVVEPVIVSARKFYHSEPERFLEFLGLLIFSGLTLINYWLVIPLCFYLIGYFDYLPRLKKLFKKKK